MYFLTKGQVEVLRGNPVQTVSVLKEGSFFGELAILKDIPRAASVRALSPGEVYVLRRTAVLQLADSHPEFNQYLEAASRHYAPLPSATGVRDLPGPGGRDGHLRGDPGAFPGGHGSG